MVKLSLSGAGSPQYLTLYILFQTTTTTTSTTTTPTTPTTATTTTSTTASHSSSGANAKTTKSGGTGTAASSTGSTTTSTSQESDKKNGDYLTTGIVAGAMTGAAVIALGSLVIMAIVVWKALSKAKQVEPKPNNTRRENSWT